MSAFAPFRSALGIQHLAVIEEAKAGQGQKGSDRQRSLEGVQNQISAGVGRLHLDRFLVASFKRLLH